MQPQICEEKLIELVVTLDDFINPPDLDLPQRALSSVTAPPICSPELSASDGITRLRYYPHAGWKNGQ